MRKYGQAVTPTGEAGEELLFGDGNDNGNFTTSTDQKCCMEVGLWAKQRFPKANIFNNNGADGIYSWPTIFRCMLRV